MNNSIFISLSEGDKRLIFAILLGLVLVIFIIGYLGFLLTKLMKWQAKKMDSLVHDAVVTKVITDKKHLLKYGRKKNWNLFLKQAYIPLLIILFGTIILIIRSSIARDFNYNLFSTDNGFGTIFFTWKLTGNLTGDDMSLIRFNKLAIDNYPHLAASAWASYIAAPCYFVGGAWYLVVTSSLVARTIKLYKRGKEIFEKSLEGYNQTEADKLNNESNSSN